jgi:Ca2+-binding RTX toxin-like protein
VATYAHSDVFFPPYWYEYSWTPPCTGPACDGVIYSYFIPVLNWSSATGWGVQSTSSTTVTLLDLGTTTVLTGSGFTFDEWNNALAGTVTKIERFDGATLLETITDIAIPLVEYQATGIAGALAGDDVINGGAYGDLLFGYSGNDTFNPGGATPAFSEQTYDLMVGGPGNDVFNGGADPGDAIVAYAFESDGNGVIVNLGTGTATDTYGDRDTLNGITAVVATSQNDQLIGGNNDETFQPLGGTDTIDGGGGFDVLTYANVNDLLGSYFFGYAGSGITVNLAGAGSGTISSECYGEDTFTGIERVVGTERDDTFNGSTADESFSGGDGNDVLNGGGGNDLLEGGAGYDMLDGGLGDDTAIISESRASVTVTLQGSQVVLDGPGGRDVLSNIERIQFSDFLLLMPAEVDDPPNDIMVVGGGSLAANEFVGNGMLVGTVVGLDPDSAVFTYSLVDNAGGRFTINAATGAIAVANGLLLDFEQNPTHVIRVRVEDQALGAFEKDFTVAVNNVDPETIIGDATANTFVGGALNDDFSGAGGSDALVGGAGNDRLSGNGGQDVLTGGLGRDILSGGTEADTFVFTSTADSVVGTNRGDVITDWETFDIIDLVGIDASTSLNGNQDFIFIGLGAANLNVREGQLKYYQSGGNTYLVGNTTADSRADFQIQITGLHTLTTENFLGLAL